MYSKKKKKNIEFVLIKECAFLIIGSNCAESLKQISDNFLLTEVSLLPFVSQTIALVFSKSYNLQVHCTLSTFIFDVKLTMNPK